jgi:hypothetical protein
LLPRTCSIHACPCKLIEKKNHRTLFGNFTCDSTQYYIPIVLIRSSNSKHDFIDEADKTTTLVDILLRKRRYKLEWAYTESNNLHIKYQIVFCNAHIFNKSVANQYQGGGGGVTDAWELLNYI